MIGTVTGTRAHQAIEAFSLCPASIAELACREDRQKSRKEPRKYTANILTPASRSHAYCSKGLVGW